MSAAAAAVDRLAVHSVHHPAHAYLLLQHRERTLPHASLLLQVLHVDRSSITVPDTANVTSMDVILRYPDTVAVCSQWAVLACSDL
jgi:hypothetical protein